MSITGLNYIGTETSGIGGITFSAVDPNSGKTLPQHYVEATHEEVNAAVAKAVNAFQEYKSIPSAIRADFLESIGDEIMALGDALIQMCQSETGLPEGRLHGERGRTVNQLRLFAQVVREGSWVEARIDTADPARTPIPKPDIRQLHIPLGPAAIFGASNFPLAFSVAGGDTASALAAGCPVVVKAHPMHPGTSELVGQAIIMAAQKTGMPEGVFSLVQGLSYDVGMALVNHPGIQAVGFTGSFKGGKALFDAANKRPVPIPVFAEMGSTNPIFILPGANRSRAEEIASGLHHSLTLGVGQFCTNPGLIITEKSSGENIVIKKLGEKIKDSSPGIMLGPTIKRNYEEGIRRIDDNHKVAMVGASPITGGETAVEARVYTTDYETFVSHKYLSEEVFGPSTINIATRDKHEMIQMAKQLEGHLTATIIGDNEELMEYQDLIEVLQTKVGRLIFNGYPTGVEVCHAMVHGGPFPATTSSQSTSVGTAAIKRFARPICFQDFPDNLLPVALQNANPGTLIRMVNGSWTREPVSLM